MAGSVAVENRLLNVAEVAEILRVKPGTVYQYVLKGDLPSVKVCGRVRFVDADLRKWIESKGRGECADARA